MASSRIMENNENEFELILKRAQKHPIPEMQLADIFLSFLGHKHPYWKYELSETGGTEELKQMNALSQLFAEIRWFALKHKLVIPNPTGPSSLGSENEKPTPLVK